MNSFIARQKNSIKAPIVAPIPALRSSWNIINVIKPKMTKRGLTKFRSKLASITHVNGYKPKGMAAKAIRVACVRRVGRDKYSAVGIFTRDNPFSGTFSALKIELTKNGFTSIKMGAIKVRL